MRKLNLATLIVLALVTTAPLAAITPPRKASIKVINQSRWAIHHLFLAPRTNHEWGVDQLGEEVIRTGQSFTLTDIECDLYDIRIVDEDGDECILERQDLCGEASTWKITNRGLRACKEDDD
jgi:hypothetical protein